MKNPFKKDDRVTLRPDIRKKGSRDGVIAKHPTKSNVVKVVWDGTRSLAEYHVDLLKRITPPRT